MDTRLGNRTDQALSHRKDRDRAKILPLAGLILLTPPVAVIFHIDAKIAGVPFTLIYVFVVWALLIAGAALLARRLRDDENADAGLADDADAAADLGPRQDPAA